MKRRADPNVLVLSTRRGGKNIFDMTPAEKRRFMKRWHSLTVNILDTLKRNHPRLSTARERLCGALACLDEPGPVNVARIRADVAYALRYLEWQMAALDRREPGKERAAEMQRLLDQSLKDNPRWTITQHRQHVAKQFGVVEKTVKRNTKMKS